MSSRDNANFEQGRIGQLRDERVYIQKKTFTKWANAFLEKVSHKSASTKYTRTKFDEMMNTSSSLNEFQILLKLIE